MEKQKDLFWVGSSKEDLKNFPVNVKQTAGYQLDRVQNGLAPTDWKPMPTVGVGVNEIRIKDEKNIFRVFYVVETKKGIYVLHAFQKKTQKTELKDIRLAKRRYKEVKRAK